MITCLGAVLCASILTQDPYSIEPELTASEEGAFALTGTTDLPDGTILRFEITRGFRGPRPRLHSGPLKVEDGRFEKRVSIFETGLIPGPYVAIVRYSESFQHDIALLKILRAAGRAKKQEAKVVFRHGTTEDFRKARLDESRRLAKEITGAVRLCRELVRACEAVLVGNKAVPEFEEEAARVQEKLDAAARRHGKRLDLRYLGLDNPGAACFGRLGKLASGMIARLIAVTKSESDPDPESTAREVWHVYMRAIDEAAEDHIEKMGLTPEGPEAARLLLARLRKDVAAVGKHALETGRLDGEKRLKETLLELAGLVPRAHYGTLTEITELTEKLISLLSDPKTREDAGQRAYVGDVVANIQRKIDRLKSVD